MRFGYKLSAEGFGPKDLIQQAVRAEQAGFWQGGYQSYQGKYLQLEDARVFDLPDRLPVIAAAAGGRAAATLAGRYATGLFATEARGDLVEAFAAAGGTGPKYAEVPMAWAPTEEAAVREVLRTTRWAVTGWKVMSELPNPANFDAASKTVTADDVREQFTVGPDAEPYVEAVRKYADAGFDHLVLQNAGPDPDGFIDFFAKELRDKLKSHAASAK